MDIRPKGLQRDQFALELGNGRTTGALALAVNEPFYCGTENKVCEALNVLHLRAIFRYWDGSASEFFPELPARVYARTYGPAGSAAPDVAAKEPVP